MLSDHLRARWLRKFLTHGPFLIPDPIWKLKGKGQGDPKPIRKTTLVFIQSYVLKSSPLCTECSEGELQYGEGSKRELVPQRDRNSVVKEKL
jgi:hypothetical protein